MKIRDTSVYTEGLPIYLTHALQYAVFPASNPCGFLHPMQIASVLGTTSPTSTWHFTSVQILSSECIGWVSAAYIMEAET